MNAIQQGRDIDSRYGRLEIIHRRMGRRRAPVIRWLSRSNLLNQLLGRMRSQLGTVA